MPLRLPGIRLRPVELEIGGEATAEFAQPSQEIIAPRLLRYIERAGAGDMDFNIVAFFKLKCIDDSGGQPHGQAVSPFCDDHG
jgi:hypothetical protein